MTQPTPTEPEKPAPTQAEPETEEEFKFQITYLAPILASLIFGLACAYLLRPIQAESVPVTPIPENTPGAPWGNAIYFVILLTISATMFYLLLKHRSKRIIKALILVAFTTASMLLSIIYLSVILSYIPPLDDLLILIALSIIITIIFDLAIFRLGNIPRNTAVICLGGALGVFFGKFIPIWSAVLILAFLAVYDVVAVYKGPVGKIATSAGLDQLEGLSYSFKDIQMGLGDLVFYSMLTGTIFFNFVPSILPTIMAIIGIMAGTIITFIMLQRRGIFPGLPFPIMLGLAAGLITGLLT
jgi:presenilin-like A22 family membrane protease